MDINNKVIWITGASSGIGEALAFALAKDGANLILSARREDELKRVADAVHKAVPSSAQPFVLPLDLTDTSTFEQKKNEAIKHFGRVDVLINNGGVSQRSLAKDTTLEVDRKLFEVNFFNYYLSFHSKR